ncbi:hypothetical protein EV363DRAFT_1248397 [Boletus edulis]|nr:hypothetical protein EV363DRAFT_1248397 [Boletus edulis]
MMACGLVALAHQMGLGHRIFRVMQVRLKAGEADVYVKHCCFDRGHIEQENSEPHRSMGDGVILTVASQRSSLAIRAAGS